MARLLWKEKAVEAVLEFLRDTRVGCRPVVIAGIGSSAEEGNDSEGEGGGDGSEGGEGGPGPPKGA